MKWPVGCLLFLAAACSADQDTIKIKGSDTEVNLAVELAESFHSTKPKVFISISGGGSGLGIASLLNGTADLANSSRSINKEEMALFRNRSIRIDSFVFAQDAIAFVVSGEMPIDSISTKTLAQIFSGGLKDWSSVTPVKRPVNIYGRQSNSGTHDFVRDKLKIAFSPHAKEMNGNAQILEAIRQDNSGIGYVGAGYVSHGGGKGLKVLTVYPPGGKAVSPLDANAIAAGKYFFQRPLFQYYKSLSYQKVRPFLDFEKSKAGKAIIQSGGYYLVD